MKLPRFALISAVVVDRALGFDDLENDDLVVVGDAIGAVHTDTMLTRMVDTVRTERLDEHHAKERLNGEPAAHR